MDRKHNHKLVPYAKDLRKNMTKEEKHLWYDYLRKYPVKFLRQKILGNYIVDFYCAKAKIAVELDGSQHCDERGIADDEKRTKYLEYYGIKVIRFSNLDVMRNFEGVCMCIDKEVQQSLEMQSPLRKCK